MPAQTSLTCPHCQIGKLRTAAETYTVVYGGTLLSAPDVPAWRCDICAYLEFDEASLWRLDLLLGGLLPADDASRTGARTQPYEADVNANQPVPRLKP